MGARSFRSFPRVKRPGRGVEPPSPSNSMPGLKEEYSDKSPMELRDLNFTVTIYLYFIIQRLR
jgi:hypothetical protein